MSDPWYKTEPTYLGLPAASVSPELRLFAGALRGGAELIWLSARGLGCENQWEEPNEGWGPETRHEKGRKTHARILAARGKKSRTVKQKRALEQQNRRNRTHAKKRKNKKRRNKKS